MRCCEAWKPIEDCIDILRCIDFQRHSNIFASFSRENLQAREAEVSTLSWTQTEDSALSYVEMANVSGATGNLCWL